MKKILLITYTVFISLSFTKSQTVIDSMYFGEQLPGRVPVVFAPDYLSVANQGEEKLTISDDGKEIYWNTHPMNYSHFQIKYSVYDSESAEWSTPEFLFDEYYSHPILTPDNNMLVVLDGNIYKSVRISEGWSEPTIIDSNIFANYDIGPIAITLDTTLCFIDITRPEHDIYLSEYVNGHFQTPERLPFPINFDNSMVNNPYIARDGSYILYSVRDIPDNYGAGDIYVSYRKDNNYWTFPKNLGNNISTSDADYGVYVSPDEKHLFYTKWGSDNVVNIHWCNIEGLIDSLAYTNCPPYRKHLIPDQTDSVGNTFVYTIPDTIFGDDDGYATLTFSAMLSNGDELPSFLSFESETITLSGNLNEAGSYNIRVTATDTAGVSVSDIFKLTVEQATAIDILNIKNTITVYPNPASGSIQISSAILSGQGSYMITDILGKIVNQGRLESETIDISSIKRGIYLLQIRHDKNVISNKIVIE